MTPLYDFPMSAAIHAARVALADPAGRTAAELAGHLALLQVSAEPRDNALAEQFWNDHPSSALGLYLAPVPDETEPDETPAEVFHRHRKDFPAIGLYGVIGACLILGGLIIGMGVA